MQWCGGAKLGCQGLCACPVLEVGGLCVGSRRRDFLGRSRRYDYNIDEYVYYLDDDEEYLAPLEENYHPAGGSNAPRWRLLWRRILQGKRRLFRTGATSAAAVPRVPYDAYTYSQNFEDPGSSTWMETDNLDRSFSARFADPSRVIRSIA